jgi:hypothetical protein
MESSVDGRVVNHQSKRGINLNQADLLSFSFLDTRRQHCDEATMNARQKRTKSRIGQGGSISISINSCGFNLLRWCKVGVAPMRTFWAKPIALHG